MGLLGTFIACVVTVIGIAFSRFKNASDYHGCNFYCSTSAAASVSENERSGFFVGLATVLVLSTLAVSSKEPRALCVATEPIAARMCFAIGNRWLLPS